MSTQASALVIRPVDPYDDADMDAFQAVYAASERAEDPDVGLYSRQDAVAMLTSGDRSRSVDAFGAFRDGRMVAETIVIGSTQDNLSVAQLLLWVDPTERRRGVGAHVLAHAESHSSSRGRTVLRVQTRIRDGLETNQRFAERHGFTRVLTEVERRLPLPADAAHLDALATRAAPHHRDYEILTFVGRVPGGLRASYVDLRNLLVVEMPHGDLVLEVERSTVADLDALDAEQESAGRTSVATLAVREGVVAAYSDLSVPGGGAVHIDQYGTLVHPAHRGHRLGTAVKCALLRTVSERFPDRAYVATSNAEVNAHMVAINVALGFAVHQRWGEFEKRLG